MNRRLANLPFAVTDATRGPGMIRRIAVGMVTLAALAVAVPDGHAAGNALVINGIVDRGQNSDARAFELYGVFPGYSEVRPEVVCDGRLMQAETMVAPTVGQINVMVEGMPGASLCSFVLQRTTDGVRSAARAIVTGPTSIEIASVVDRGVTNGRRFVELYGRFHYDMHARVLCAGRYSPTSVGYNSARQVNVSMPDAGPAGNCAFALRNLPIAAAQTPLFGSLPGGSTMTPGFGGYNWGGVPPRAPNALQASQAALNAAGFDTTRMVITPKMRSGVPFDNYYNLNLAGLTAACPLNTPFLPCAIRYAPYQAAISSPHLRTIVLTAYDSASHGPTGQLLEFVNLPFWASAANRKKVSLEYENMTFALYQTQRNTGKTFIVTSWEADNQAYCDSFYGYLTDQAARDKCGTIASRAEAILAMTAWFRARRAGILAGKKRAATAGYGGVTVADGIEFNMNSLTNTYDLAGTVLPTVLRKIIPSIQPSFVLYSSYDSQFRGHMEQDLRQIRSWLASNSPRSQLIIGEVGFPRHGIGTSDTFRTVETVKAVQRVGLRNAILWEAFDTGAADPPNYDVPRIQPFGLLHASGAQRSVTRILRQELAAQATEIAANPDARILAANDAGVSDDGGILNRHYELYGSFPGGPFSASALCDGVETFTTVTYQSIGQINVSLSHKGYAHLGNRFCTFRVHRANGTQSLAFGPVVACEDRAWKGPCF